MRYCIPQVKLLENFSPYPITEDVPVVEVKVDGYR